MTFNDSNPRSPLIGTIIFLVSALFYMAQTWANEPLLDAETAFKINTIERPAGIDVHVSIANGYYMYRERFGFSVKRGEATLGEPMLPQGQIKFDATLQKKIETYRHDIIIHLPVTRAVGSFELAVHAQGCADQGLCYSPITHLTSIKGIALQSPLIAATPSAIAAARPAILDQAPRMLGDGLGITESGYRMTGYITRLYSPQYAEAVLAGHDLFTMLIIFFILGVALSLFPCSLPMIPILSALIVGEGIQLSRWRSFMLSAAYVLGMAVVYTIFGMAAASAGYSLGPDLQSPWVRGAVALLLFVFALSLWGCYELQLPQSWQNRINTVLLQHKLRGGKWLAVFTMGALSALIVGACMTAPLFGVLTFIAHTGNLVIGGGALFSMALGMGVPLLLVGIGAGHLLPRAGAWMSAIKRTFALLLTAVALWLVWPLLKPLQPLPAQIEFTRIQSNNELQHRIKTSGRPSLLEFYADWCANCREMEKITFTDSRVQTQLRQFNLLRADVTNNNLNDRALLKQFGLYGPPAIIFFDANGDEIQALRMVGYQSPSTFLKKLEPIYRAP
ncbi:protein-disulfide reductase DsbD [Mycoavidus sp. SF9855]|uniref:protein-disulfide reductase DsbD n=1 Tax=Mycoavidus sp. SF9855 TaxID=2968475 RepID=UPI00211C4E9E|nr:protein-disulfide reductase DsbD [Mycoavidus sp. SF9855]UUM21778.1 protein-disulfide reductase DsbD [Mycoavidus sp. SF9855]